MPGLVVLHVHDAPADVQRAISAANTITLSGGMVVRIIVNGPAITSVIAGAEAIYTNQHISVEACERALMSHDLSTSDLQPGVTPTSSAVVAIARAQHQGAAYIRI